MAYELQAEVRTIFGKKVKTLRQAGKVPAEIYGNNVDNVSIQVDAKHLKQVLNEAGSTNVIAVSVDDQEPIMALPRNIQYSILKRDLLHVDFYKIIMTETVVVTIPIQLFGTSPLIEDEGGTLVSGINSLEIEALPDRLPELIEVDVSVLQSFSDSISVSDLSIPEGVTVHSNLDSLVATIQPPRLIDEDEEEDEVAELELGEEEEEITDEEDDEQY